MKKNLLMLLLIFCAGHSLYAQQAEEVSEKKNLWRTEIGTAFTGTGDLWGNTIYLEYGRYLTSRFRLSPAVGVWLFQRNDQGNFNLLRTATAKSFDLTGYYEIALFGGVKAEVGAGGFARNWNWAYATGPTSGFSTGEFNLPPGSYGTIAENTVGYTLSAGVLVGLTEAIGWNARATLQNDTGGNTALTARAGFKIRF
jgi:hypothetical protein